MAVPQNNIQAALLMAASMFVFAAVDTIAKVLTADLSPVQIVWMRQMGLAAAGVFLIARYGTGVMQTGHLGLQVLRGVLGASSAVLFITGVALVPLATAQVVTFVAPFLVTVLAAVVLREQVGLRRWIAVVVGFGGTLVVIRPGMEGWEPATLLIVLAAFLFSLRQIVSRRVSEGDRAATTVAYSGFVSVGLFTLALPVVWITPNDPTVWVLLVGIAVLAGLGETLLIKALEVGLAVVVAPIHYTILVWGLGYGWLVFGDLPDLWTWIGAVVIIATGLYVVRREWLARQRATRDGG